jgi:hypothetical protein
MYNPVTVASMNETTTETNPGPVRSPCPHGAQLTREEGAEHMACTAYGRKVNPRTLDRWADRELITRQKVQGLQWVRFNRAELDALAAGLSVEDDQLRG